MTRMQGLGSTGLGSKQPELASEPISESQDSDSDGDAQSAYPSRSDSESRSSGFGVCNSYPSRLPTCYPGHFPSRCIWGTLADPSCFRVACRAAIRVTIRVGPCPTRLPRCLRSWSRP